MGKKKGKIIDTDGTLRDTTAEEEKELSFDDDEPNLEPEEKAIGEPLKVTLKLGEDTRILDVEPRLIPESEVTKSDKSGSRVTTLNAEHTNYFAREFGLELDGGKYIVTVAVNSYVNKTVAKTVDKTVIDKALAEWEKTHPTG